MQVRYLNKALQRFDSTQVIPIQFVLFTLSVIIGSAVLYRDFERTTGQQAAKFVGGCLLTFFGVFLITSGRPRGDENEDGLSDDEDVEETIGLHDQDPQSPHAPSHAASMRGTDGSRSESRRSSRVGFFDGINKPLAALAGVGSGIPSPRQHVASAAASRMSLPHDGAEPSSLFDNRWTASTGQGEGRPGMPPHAFSADSIITFSGPSSGPGPELLTPATPPNSSPIAPYPTVAGVGGERPPATPRLSFSASPRPHSHHFAGPLISPSPLSSTVSAVVSDQIRGFRGGTPSMRRLTRRSRPSLRASLFVPQDDVDGGEAAPSPSNDSRDRLSTTGGDGASERAGLLRGEPESTAMGRARSLSNTLGDLLGGRRRRRDTETENADDEEGQGQGTVRRHPLAGDVVSPEPL